MMRYSKDFLAACLWLSTACGTAMAQSIPQDPVSRAATEVQQEAARGQISPKEAGSIEGKLWQLKSEEQQDLARHGGHLTPQDNQQIWSEIRSIQGDTSFNGNNWNSGSRHGGILRALNNNNNQNQSAGYPSQYEGYPGGGGPDGYPHGPGRYENANTYNGENGFNSHEYANSYDDRHFNDGNAQSNNNNNNNNSTQSGSKFSQAAGILQNLLHH